ncbi:MAG TPA: 2-phosphosulfolactate phosphatase [Rhodanobacteraceae bacterium]|nr:2-phosphosulfolactate phosphatase [Rhodanobacteraceae bacterium]
MSIPDSVYAQAGYRCRLDWGWRGARQAAARGDIVVIVDVLRFSSAVAMAAQHGVIVYPCEMQGDVEARSREVGGVAGGRSLDDTARFSLSPRTFEGAEPGTRVVLASLNGAMCSINARGAPHAFAASLLNASAVAAHVVSLLDADPSLDVTVVACGERWRDANEDGELRFAVEDYLGAGAVLSELSHERSPETAVCAAAFAGSRGDIAALLWECASGRELRSMGLEQDVIDCARIDVYDAVPVLRDGAYARL